MKKYILTLLFIVTSIAGMSQTIGEAFYIYRNDGQFNAFFRDEVDSIVYVTYDADSVFYDEVVTQIVYTRDSTYYIPLAAIDSVGFVQPETIYNGQVVRMEPMLPYIISVDGLVVTFSSDIPSSLMPKVGDVLLYDSFDSELMPEGFAGRVVQCLGQQVVCESVSFEDIYEQIVCYGSYTAVDDETSSSMRLVPRRVAGHISTAIDIGGTLGSTGSGLYGSLNGRLGLDLCITFKYNKGMNPYFDLSVSPNMRIKFEAGVKGNFSKNVLSNKVNLISLPIPDTPFLFKLKAGPALKPSLKASVTITTEASLGYKFGVKYEDGEFKGYGQNTSKWFSMPDVSGSISGSIFAGMQTEFGIFSYGDLLSLSIEKEAGAEFVANLTEDLLASDKYEELQNAQFDLNLKASVGLAAKAKFFKWVIASANWTLLSGQLNINSWKLVPKFKKPIVTVSGPSSAIISVKPSEKLLFPVSVGVGVWDNSGNLQDAQYCADTYRVLEDWPHTQYQAIVSNLSSGQNYNAYPLLKLFGAEIKATPSEVFQTKTIPVRITRFNQTNSEYSKNAFTNDGVQYSYKYDCEVTVTLDDATDVADWGYVYEDPYGNLALISLKSFASPYTDTRYSYYRNESSSTVRLYEYIKYTGTNKYYYGEPHDFPLEYGETTCPDSNHPHMIDLGLPSGTKWACCNVGAHKPEEFGGYFAWGETKEKSEYRPGTYQHAHVDSNVDFNGWRRDDTTQKYYSYNDIGSNIAGTSYDAATANWGAPWRMPTLEQCQELINNCKSEWISLNGVYGRKFTGLNGGTIFLPAAGLRWYSKLYYDSGSDEYNSYGYYWSSTSGVRHLSSSTLGESYENGAYVLYFFEWDESASCYIDCYRNGGRSVRPVRKN